MLQSETADGRQLGFLASETAYLKVRALETEGRVVPMVGDLAGPHTLRRIATELRRNSLVLGTAYLSNVEQYLFEDGIWCSWFENLKRMPRHPEAIVLRTHLDQGRAHPRQWPGHRFTTIAHAVGARDVARLSPTQLLGTGHGDGDIIEVRCQKNCP